MENCRRWRRVSLSLPHFVITRRDCESDPDVDADTDANATEVIVALCNYHVNQYLSVSTTMPLILHPSQIVKRGIIEAYEVDREIHIVFQV
ncbi:unnamed protein product [Sphenostylis stenocarpa]|uniref:Uncharacterized protein n=1 Tax=Sphenostylis stenocarpa TaxID=92480 RepID=A0AA86RVY5_9FABA|nr:unnamed protein product [Sphenostylis stenocarpa]